MHISDQQLRQFHTNGHLLLKNVAAVRPLLEAMREEVRALGSQFRPGRGDDIDAQTIAALAPAQRQTFYRGLRYLPATTQLACSELLLDIGRRIGLARPAVMHSYNLRMDMPHETQFLFHWHQDVTYLLGSANSVTYWVPLGTVDAHHGSVEVIDGSHRQGLVPFHYTGDGPVPPHKPMSPRDIRLDADPTARSTTIEAEAGDILVFSQFLLHRSTPNLSNDIRWVAQVRHSDFAEPEFQRAGFPFGDVTNIFQHEYLK